MSSQGAFGGGSKPASEVAASRQQGGSKAAAAGHAGVESHGARGSRLAGRTETTRSGGGDASWASQVEVLERPTCFGVCGVLQLDSCCEPRALTTPAQPNVQPCPACKHNARLPSPETAVQIVPWVARGGSFSGLAPESGAAVAQFFFDFPSRNPIRVRFARVSCPSSERPRFCRK